VPSLFSVSDDDPSSPSSSSLILEGAIRSSEYDSGAEVCEVGFVASGRMIIHGGHSFMRSASCGGDESVSHSFSFFATQGF
jgi:hypothetical protein